MDNRKTKRRQWTTEEIVALENAYKHNESIEEFARKVDRSFASVRNKASKLGFPSKYIHTPLYKLDLSGKTFGKLTVIKNIGDDGFCHTKYECMCECGNITIVSDANLRYGHTKSCGCLVSEKTREANKKYNEYDLSGEFGIGYTSNNKPFYFDLEDYDKIKNLCWNIYGEGYVEARNGDRIEHLHRVVMGISYDDEYSNIDVDHIGGHETRYDNRKINLRLATRSHNLMNKRVQSNNTSGVTGVSYNSKTGLWEAQLWYHKKHMQLGVFSDKNDAIKARKNAEEKYFKEWSYDNSQKIRDITHT